MDAVTMLKCAGRFIGAHNFFRPRILLFGLILSWKKSVGSAEIKRKREREQVIKRIKCKENQPLSYWNWSMRIALFLAKHFFSVRFFFLQTSHLYSIRLSGIFLSSCTSVSLYISIKSINCHAGTAFCYEIPFFFILL